LDAAFKIELQLWSSMKLVLKSIARSLSCSAGVLIAGELLIVELTV
jgi:hypothetical protein